MVYQSAEFEAFPQRYRANFFNSILGYKPANLIATKNKQGIENLAIFSSAVHLGAHPPLIGLVSRPDSVPRNTLENIRNQGFFTLNHVSGNIISKAHQTSARYPEGVSEFEKVGLSPIYLSKFSQPFVKESQVKLGLELKEIIAIKWNQTYLIIGEVTLVDIENKHLLEDGSLDYKTLYTISVTGLDTYHKTSQITKLPYAKADQIVK